MSRAPERLLIAVAFALGCSSKKTAPPAPPPEDAAPTSLVHLLPSARSNGASPPGFRFIEADARTASAVSAVPDASVDPCEGSIRSGRPVGHTSVAFKVELSSGSTAAWKPDARRVRGRYRGEVAAYRLARVLGIPNVPVACLRTFEAAELARVLPRDEDIIVTDGRVHGTLVPWIEGLGFWAIEREPLRGELRRWLGAASVPDDKADLVRQVSILVGFDFVTGNWDRYSGENVGLDRTGAQVLFIDNDAAFMEGPPREELAKNRSRADSTERWSRSFVQKLRGLDEEALASAVGEETPGVPLLSRGVVHAAALRAQELVRVVDAKIAARGEAATLPFP